MKVVNDSEKDFEFWFNGKPHVMKSGQVYDYRQDVAEHAMKKSMEIDEFAEPGRTIVVPLETAKGRGHFKDYANLTCPYVNLDECDHAPFVTSAQLTKHVAEKHSTAPEKSESKTVAEKETAESIVCSKCGKFDGSRSVIAIHERHCKG